MTLATHPIPWTARAAPAASGRASRGAQPRVVALALAALVAGAIALAVRHGVRQGALFLVGAACGLALYHATFGFGAAFRALVTARDARAIQAHLLLFAVATVLFAPLLAAGQVFARPVVPALAPAGVAVLAGAFLFGIGMQLGGGCASGTLFQLGGGRTPLALTLVGFAAGSVLATFHMPFWWGTPSLGEVSLGAGLGWPTAVVLQLAALGIIAVLIGRVGARRSPSRLVEPRAAPGWARLWRGPWSLVAGALALALLDALTLALAGHPWTISWGVTLWGGKALEAVGYDLATVPFWSGGFAGAGLAAPVLADVTSVMNLGLVGGALLAAGLAGRFAPGRRVGLRVVAASVIGGILLGYGARVAYGCNIGAYLGGIASTSLHGWLWGIAALAATPLGVRLRRAFGLDDPAHPAPSC